MMHSFALPGSDLSLTLTIIKSKLRQNLNLGLAYFDLKISPKKFTAKTFTYRMAIS